MANVERLRRKQYGEAALWEAKLHRVMERFAISEYNWNYDRWGAWVSFRYKGQLYRFDHTVDKGRARGISLHFGTDCFAQIVLSLEDLVKMAERGVYDLETWVAGMRVLPQALETPAFFKALGFPEIPANVEDVKARYRSLASTMHPDAGGDETVFKTITAAAEQATNYLAEREANREKEK